MNIFLITILYFVVITVSICFIYFLNKWTKTVREHKVQIDKFEAETYTNLREVQFKSREFSKLVNKLREQKKEFLNDIVANLLMTFLPFTKLKAVLLVKRFLKKI